MPRRCAEAIAASPLNLSMETSQAPQEPKPQGTDFVALLRDEEKRILEYWDTHGIFQKTLEQTKGAKPFVFFDGPPTANGLPHVGHFLTRIYKDLYGRYKTMQGFHVLRRAGWDTHGLPVELEIEKELGLKSKKEIEEYGIAEFNKKAKASVWKYTHAWGQMTKRIGFWIDLEDRYITYDPKFMESIWWAIKTISGRNDEQDRPLLYQGHKVLPFCTRCGTALSSHEVAQGYKEVTDTSAYVKFAVKEGQKIQDRELPRDSFFVAWTTTPWTLPGNVALAVNTKLTYVLAKLGEEYIILAKDRLAVLGENYVIEKEFSGADIVGLGYQPLFHVEKLQSETSHKIYGADFVTATDGTGIVHTAVMYGEDDYELGKHHNLPMHHTVNQQGMFTDEVSGFAGQNVREAQAGILEYLESRNALFKTEAYVHTYPHCWRCKTPLIYYAKGSWFIRMSSLRKGLLERNAGVNWAPEHIRDGRFGEFLKEAKDWALSRERYWGTPLPAWKCAHCNHISIVGSLADLDKMRMRSATQIFAVRHGQALHNTKGLVGPVAEQYDKDNHLTELGKEQVSATIEQLKEKNIDVIIASPAVRAQETAKIISDALGISVITHNELHDYDTGELDGKTIEDANRLLTFQQRLEQPFPGGESLRDVRKRMMNAVKEITNEYKGKKVLLVSHGDPLWALHAALEGVPESEYPNAWYPTTAEVKQLTLHNWPYNDEGELDVHRPYIDNITIKCTECKKETHRVKDLIDVWFDSGTMPYAQWHYPFENKKRLDSTGKERQYPADFIVEAVDQTRGWFYTMMAIATALDRPAPYKNVGVLGFVTNDQGKKLSKSEGAGEGFAKILDENSVDALRWYFYTVSDLGEDKRFSLNEVNTKLRNFHVTLLNVLRFLELYGDVKATELVSPKSVLDKWLYAQLRITIQDVTYHLDHFDPTTAARALENFVVTDLSQWWLRLSRPRFQRPESPEELAHASAILRDVLHQVSLLLAPFVPFFAEYVDQHLYTRTAGDSVHLGRWPVVKKLPGTDILLTNDMTAVRELVTAGLAIRKQQQLKVRQPLASATLKREQKFAKGFEELIKAELNVKKIMYNATQEQEVALDTTLTRGLVLEGIMRDVMRQIQDLRKESGLQVDVKANMVWHAEDKKVIAAIEKYKEQITKDTLLASFEHVTDMQGGKETKVGDGAVIWLALK